MLEPFKFCYFLLNLFNPSSIAVVWFCSSVLIFVCSFQIIFINRLFIQMSSKKCFGIIYSDSLISCSTIMVASKNRSSLNNRSVKYLLRVFKIESSKNICKKVYFWLRCRIFFFFQGVIRFCPSVHLENLLNSYFATVILENI